MNIMIQMKPSLWKYFYMSAFYKIITRKFCWILALAKGLIKGKMEDFFQFFHKYKLKLLCSTVLTWATYGVIIAPTRDIQAHVPKPTDRTIVGYTYNSTKQPVKAFSNQAYYATMSLSGGGCLGCPGASTFSKASPSAELDPHGW